MHLMGRSEGIGPKHTKSCLKVAHRSDNPKKITQTIVGSMFGSPMHNRSIGLEGEERLGSCKRKFNTMIGFIQNSHQLDKLNFSVPLQ
jgi:hypothetical protein